MNELYPTTTPFLSRIYVVGRSGNNIFKYIFESLKLFLMRECFIFCSVHVVGFNTGPLGNLVFAILILLSPPPLPNPLT